MCIRDRCTCISTIKFASHDTVCTFGSLLDLLKPHSHKWYQLGFHFGLKLEKLNSMIKLNRTPEQLLYETLRLKLESGEEVTWGDVAIVLYGAGEKDLVHQVARVHGGAGEYVIVLYTRHILT